MMHLWLWAAWLLLSWELKENRKAGQAAHSFLAVTYIIKTLFKDNKSLARGIPVWQTSENSGDEDDTLDTSFSFPCRTPEEASHNESKDYCTAK